MISIDSISLSKKLLGTMAGQGGAAGAPCKPSLNINSIRNNFENIQSRSQAQNSLLAISTVDRFWPWYGFPFRGYICNHHGFSFMQSHGALPAVIAMGIPTVPMESQWNTFNQTTCHVTWPRDFQKWKLWKISNQIDLELLSCSECSQRQAKFRKGRGRSAANKPFTTFWNSCSILSWTSQVA